MSVLMQRFLLAALSVLGILILFSLLYAVLGRRFTDKIVAANMIGTLGINMIVILAVLILGEGLSPWGAAGIVFIAIGTIF